VSHGRLHPPRRTGFDASRLHCAPPAVWQRQAAVKLHGVFASHRGSLAYAPGSGFAGPQPGTVGTSLRHSCRSAFNRQGISLHCDLRFTQPQAPLLPKLQGQFAEFPRLGLPRHALGFSPRGTSVGSRYGHGGSFSEGFSRAPGIDRTSLTGGHSRFHPVLAITALPGLIRLAGLVDRSAYPEASPSELALPHLPPWYGNINPFPFRQHRVTG